MSRIYIAGPYAGRDRLRRLVAEPLADAGHCITAGWLHEDTPTTERYLGAAYALEAGQVDQHVTGDLGDIRDCDVLLAVTPGWLEWKGGARLPMSASGGRHVEFGYAVAHHKRLLHLGTPENVFTRALAQEFSHLYQVMHALEGA